MTTDEIEVFRTAYDDGEWQVHADNESIIRIDDVTGKIVTSADRLDPELALSIARDYARENGLRWKPAFTLVLKSDGWEVGCCQSQFGGQTYINLSHDGKVLRHWINPK